MPACLSCSAVVLRFLMTSSMCRLGVWSLSRAFMGSLWSMLMSMVLFWILIWRVSVLFVLSVISPCSSVCIKRVSVCCGLSVGASLFL